MDISTDQRFQAFFANDPDGDRHPAIERNLRTTLDDGTSIDGMTDGEGKSDVLTDATLRALRASLTKRSP